MYAKFRFDAALVKESLGSKLLTER